ncbi:MAG: SAM-dependent chlorinase/fluorinase [Bacteroidetes bacterium]|jgi:S-adenosylmethionine hydrolase|nr:SAM-dependent chlorinase/fluorinase [Bacteroidota bacterium]
MPKTSHQRIVTLTTDYGVSDYSVAVLKGALLQQEATLNIIDITHQVQPNDILQGAFIFKNAWRSFPKGCIHILSINNYSTNHLRFIAIEFKDHFFIGPDNGIFSLVFEKLPSKIYEFDYLDNAHFSHEAIFAYAIGHFTSGKSLVEIGPSAKNVIERLTLNPVISSNIIRGSVIFVDCFENVVLNIRKDLFENTQNKRNFELYFKRNDPIKELNEYYYDVPVGEILCFFNASDYLEIAINMGKASSLLGLKLGDSVEVRFL